MMCDAGIGISSNEAFAALVLPDSETATDFPERGWIWREGALIAQPNVSQVVQLFDRDIRSMRKIDDGDLWISITNTLNSGSPFSIVVTGYIRCLFKLS